ncbi:MAG: hypothetical protein LQ337_007906 [Flavoplaca oasis]|nr:MAG: hypothetical protein LQ337_007906 [Flavoplaca oasis]
MTSSRGPLSLAPVLVIGGCGFVGHAIVCQLMKARNLSPSEIHVLDLHVDRNRESSVNYHKGSITEKADVERIFANVKPRVVIHTASPVVDPRNNHIYHKVNVDGTRILLDYAAQTGTQAFVHTSSPSIVHDNVSDLVMADENLPVLHGSAQTEIYSRTKGEAEDLVLASNGKYGMPTCAIRPSGIFGPGECQILQGMMKAYEEGKTKFQLGSNENYFDFTEVNNVAIAHILAAEKLLQLSTEKEKATKTATKVDGEAFIITNDDPYKFWDFTHAVWAAAGDRTTPEQRWVIPKGLGLVLATLIEWVVWIIFLGTREPSLTRQKVKYSAMTRTFNIDKAKTRLGYKPIVNMQDGIANSVAWYKAQRSAAKKDL